MATPSPNPFQQEIARRERGVSENPFAAELARRASTSDADANESGIIDDAARLTNQFSFGFNSFLADAIEAAEFMTGGRPPEGSDVETLKGKMVEFLRGRMEEPKTTAERAARSAGRFTGENLLPSGAVATAAKGVPAAVQAGLRSPTPATAPLGERVRQTVLAGSAQAPKAVATTETAASAGAGATGQVAAEAFGESARSSGEFAGALAPSIPTPTSAVTRGVKAVAGRFMTTPQQIEQRAKQNVGTVLSESLGSETAEQNLRATSSVQSEIAGFQPTLAEATGLPSLIRTQRALEQASSGADLDGLVARRGVNEQLIRDFAAARAPDAREDVGEIADIAAKRIQRLTGDIGLQQEGLREARAFLADRIRPVDRSVVGDTIREAIQAERSAASERMNDLAQQIGLNDVDLTVPFGQFRQSVARWARNMLPSERKALPEAVRDILSIEPGRVRQIIDPQTGQVRGTAKSRPITFKQIKAVRESITDEIRDVMRSQATNRRKRLRNLSVLRGMVDDQLMDRVSDVDPALADDYERFRARYFNEFIRPFERGAVRKALQNDGTGFFRTLNEDVADTFLESQDAARQFSEVLGDRPEARDALVAATLDRINLAAVRDGQLDAKRFATWARQHRDALSELPFVASRLSDVQSVNDALISRQATLTNRQRAVENSILGRRLAQVGRGQATPEQFIERAVQDPRVMSSLLKSLPSDAKSALKRQVWDFAAGMDAPALATFLEENERSLTRLLGREHMTDLITIQAARLIANRVPKPGGQAISVNPLQAIEDELGIQVRSLASRYANIKALRISQEYAAVDLFGRLLRQQTALENQRLLREALFNPEVARQFADMVLLKNRAPERFRRLRAHLFTIGARAMSNELDQSEDEPNG